ncbi:glycosyltransferase family 4 protein [Nitrosophilus kaiyonis]|uniref:glycosyltransferase family 4 protein n=1 Tax=Nitrosophilus kaiyonis TaxID=2930200 RepID=UPI002491DCD9|nr:glycosyltransferase family 4 protein [Nitrosophilus kaiyonis]
MNILHTETLKGWGGQQNKTLKELIISKKLGHNVFLICNPNAKIKEKAFKYGIKVIEIEMNKKNFHKTIPFFLKFIKENSIDVIFSHGSTDSWIVAIAGNLSSKKPYLIRERHNLFPIKGFLSKILHKSLFNKIIYISPSVKNYLLQIGVHKKNLFYLPDAVDIKHFNETLPILKKEFNIPSNSIVLGVFTSLTKQKGVYDFFEVAKEVLKRYDNLYVVFGGNYSKDAKDKIDSFFYENAYELDRIIWTGFREDGAKIVKDFDIFLFPSHSEGLGTVILEAMAASLPIIVYDIEPMNILIKSGYNGFTVPFLDTKKLTNATIKLIENENLRKEMSENSFDFVSKNYSEEVLENRLKKLYGEIIE